MEHHTESDAGLLWQESLCQRTSIDCACFYTMRYRLLGLGRTVLRYAKRKRHERLKIGGLGQVHFKS